MRFLVDSNIVIDLLARREPFCADAELLFLCGAVGEHELWITSAQANDIFYVLSGGAASGGTVSGGTARSHTREIVKSLRLLRRVVHICGIDEEDFDAALESTFDDFEDACVHQAALKVRADAIITRDAQGFARSSIKVFDCSQLFEWLAAEHGRTYDELVM